MRKRVYWVLEALYHGDIVSGFTCKLDGISSRVRNEIHELRHQYKVKIISVPEFIGRHTSYYLDESKENLEHVETLLKTCKTKSFSNF